MSELLIGCGNSRVKKVWLEGASGEWNGLVTMDHDPNCGADVVHDLEAYPWPFADNTFDECHAYCVLEHLGRQGDYKSFFATFAEIYRVLKPGGVLYAICPSRESPWAFGDPSHTRLIQPESLVFLSQEEYTRQIGKSPMTDFRWIWQGDFDILGSHDNKRSHQFALGAVKPSRISRTPAQNRS